MSTPQAQTRPPRNPQPVTHTTKPSDCSLVLRTRETLVWSCAKKTCQTMKVAVPDLRKVADLGKAASESISHPVSALAEHSSLGA